MYTGESSTASLWPTTTCCTWMPTSSSYRGRMHVGSGRLHGFKWSSRLGQRVTISERRSVCILHDTVISLPHMRYIRRRLHIHWLIPLYGLLMCLGFLPLLVQLLNTHRLWGFLLKPLVYFAGKSHELLALLLRALMVAAWLSWEEVLRVRKNSAAPFKELLEGSDLVLLLDKLSLLAQAVHSDGTSLQPLVLLLVLLQSHGRFYTLLKMPVKQNYAQACDSDGSPAGQHLFPPRTATSQTLLIHWPVRHISSCSAHKLEQPPAASLGDLA
jgi:hypothetical protein